MAGRAGEYGVTSTQGLEVNLSTDGTTLTVTQDGKSPVSIGGGGGAADYRRGNVLSPETDPTFPTSVAGGKTANFDRFAIAAAGSAIQTGQPDIVACPVYPGLTISNISPYCITSSAPTITNKFWFLTDTSFNVLGTTVDSGAAIPTASTYDTLAMVTPYVVPVGVYLVYVGLQANYTGTLTYGVWTAGNLGLAIAAPPIAGRSATTGVTNTASLPATLGAVGVSAGSRKYIILS